MNLRTAKVLASIGLVLSILSTAKATLGLVGVILYLVGMYHIAAYYGKREMFNYALISTVGFTAAVIVIAFLVGIGAVLGGLAAGPAGIGASLVVGLVLLYVAVLFMGKYKSDLMGILAPHSDEKVAGWAAKLYWYGAILTIILVGLLLLLLAEILEVVVLATLRPLGAGAQTA
ncbi:MAG: DUF996 domain-containing protein [Thermoproteota archaeon]